MRSQLLSLVLTLMLLVTPISGAYERTWTFKELFGGSIEVRTGANASTVLTLPRGKYEFTFTLRYRLEFWATVSVFVASAEKRDFIVGEGESELKLEVSVNGSVRVGLRVVNALGGGLILDNSTLSVKSLEESPSLPRSVVAYIVIALVLSPLVVNLLRRLRSQLPEGPEGLL